MFGIKYIKFESTTYVIHYKNGKIKKEGRGLSFYYYSPSSSIAAVPLGSNDIQFIFNDTTNDYQTITIQGQITYKIENPKQLAELLDFTVNAKGEYKTDDAEKLSQRIISEAQTATSSYIGSLSMRETLRSAQEIEIRIKDGLSASEAVKLLGVQVLSVNVVSVKPTPEMSRALETATREALQQEADEAVYKRRNFAVEQERQIKESELNTEIAVEEKKKQISEKKMEARLLEEGNKRKVREIKINADIAIEEQKKQLIDMQTDNERKEADSKKYTLEAVLAPYKDMDWRILMAIGNNGTDPKSNMAVAFRQLAENADKIGNLNISPELLNSIIKQTNRNDFSQSNINPEENAY